MNAMVSGSGDHGGKASKIRQELDSDLVSSAEDAGVDVDESIERKIQKHEGYGASTVLRFVENDIRQQIESEKAEVLKGIHMGSRDRYGKNWPRRHSLIRSSGDHLEVSSWDGTLPGPGGEEVKVPAGGAKVQFRCAYDDQYDSYEAKGLDAVDPMDTEEVAENVAKVAVPPSGISASDEYEVVAVKGTVSYVDAQTMFKDGEPAGEGPVLMEDSRGELQPHFEISLAKEGGTTLRGHVERQGHGRPYFAVTDLMNLLKDGYEQYESPNEQAGFVRNGIQGMDVLLVGNVNSFDTSRDGDGNPVQYVDIGVTAMVEADADVDEGTAAGGATTGTAEQAESADDEEPADEAGEPYEGSDEETDDDGPEVDEVADDIETYAGLVGEDIEGLTVSDIVENAAGIEAPESVIQHALRSLQSDDEPEEETEEEDDGGSVDVEEEFASLKESGMFQCPDSKCPGKGSSVADLMLHVVDEHVEGGGEEARTWVEGRM